MKIQLLLAFILSLVSFFSFSQLGGTYTVGHPGDDFPHIDSAIAALQQQGTNAPVTFLVSDGQYGSISLSDFQPLSGDSLVIRSASGNPHNVVFKSGIFSSCRNVTLHGLGFKKTQSTVGTVLEIASCDLFRLTKCRIDDATPESAADEATLKIRHTFDSTYFTRVFVDSCFISGPDGLNPVNYRFTLMERGSHGRTYYHADTILGGWNMWSSYYREFSDCYLRLDEGADEAGNAHFVRCQLLFQGEYRLRTGKLKSCYVESPDPYSVDLAADSVVNTIFNAGARADYLSNSYYGGNTFRKSFGNSFGTGFFIGNSFLGNTYFGMDYQVIVNNFFADTTHMNGGIYHNNFGPSSLVTIYGGSQLQQNNFGRFAGYYPLDGMLNNNFMAHDDTSLSMAYFDPQARFYDPEYISDTDLHIRNPALAGLGIPVIYYALKDFDGETRSNQPTIGADEICISLPLRDTLFLQCGTVYPLKSCNMPGLQWKPDNLITSGVNGPVVLVDAPKLLWLEDAQGNHIDSMLLFPLQPAGSGKRTFTTGCGIPGQYATYAPFGTTVTWEPAWAVSDPASPVVTITPESSMQVIATVDAGVCGVHRDTLELIVDPAPTGYILWDSTRCLEYYFHGYYRCVDSVRWEFGDGTTSTDMNLTMHAYPQHGSYTATLTSWNDGIPFVFSHQVVTGCVGLEEHEAESFLLYPNPVSDLLHISAPAASYPFSFDIFDRSGRLLRSSVLTEGETVNVSALSAGVYFLSINGIQKIFLKQ